MGTFKPFIKHPLSEFKKKFEVGQILKRLQVIKCLEWGLFYTIKHNNNQYKALLHRKDIADGFIKDCRDLKKALNDIPLCISSIDMENNKLTLSLVDLVDINMERIDNLKYEDVYDGHVIAQNKKDFIVLIKGVWVVGKLETEKLYNLGDKVEVRPVSTNGKLILTDN